LTFHIVSIVRLFCLLTGTAIAFTGAARGLPGAWYAIGFVVVLYLFTSKKSAEAQPLIILVSIAMSFYYVLRLWDYYVFDVGEADSFQPIGKMILSGTGADAMRFMMFATLAMYAGLALSFVRWGGKPEPAFVRYVPEIDHKLFGIFLFGVIGVELLMNFTHADFLGNASFAEKFISIAVNHETILPLAATVFLGTRRLSDKVQFYVFLILTIGTRLVEGSRSGPLDVVEIMLAWAIIPGNWNFTFKLSASKIALYLFLVILAIGGFVLATYIRQTYLYQIDTKAVASSIQSWDDFVQIVTLTYHQISYRVGTNMDALLWIFSDYYDHAYADAHINFTTMVQTTLRRLVQIPMDPGFTFEEFEFANLLGNRGNWVNGVLFPTGYSWGVFGYFYQVFGYMGSLLVLFGTCFGLGRLFNVLKGYSPGWGRTYALYWVAHATELLVPLFGVSNLLARMKGSILPFIMMALVLAWFEAKRARENTKAGNRSGSASEI
jgi:hypothetical protein